MTKKPQSPSKDFCKFSDTVALQVGDSTPFGQSHISVEIYKRQHVSNLDSYLGYLIMMKNRIIIPNATIPTPGSSAFTSYLNYPAILLNQVEISVNNGGSIKLHQMSPKTLNTTVSTSSTNGTSASAGSTQETSSGSSTSNVNSFGVGISLGFFGESPVANISSDYSMSSDYGSSYSNSQGRTTGSDSNIGFGDSMSVKDWSCYGYLDATFVNPQWLWGQSYPWDVIQYNQSTGSDDSVNLPQFVINNLLNGTVVLPPSQLSLFGTDFTMQAGWIVDFPSGVTTDEEITLNFTTTSFTASHMLSEGTFAATLQSEQSASKDTFTPTAIDLSTFALVPVTGGDGTGAAIGFTATPFTYPPSSGSSFKIVSPGNNVQVTGSGFDSTMTSDFSDTTSITVTIKVADFTVDYVLSLMHWIGSSGGAVMLAWQINNNSASGTIFVDSTEGSGGQNNLSQIELRNTDFTSINFHDYLVIGTNTITITISPVNTTASNSYTLFALAIGRS